MKGGRIPQFADGKYPTSSFSHCPPLGDERSGGGQDDYLQTNNELIIILGNLTTEIQELRKYRPSVAVETIEKELNNYSAIKISTGL